MRNLIRIGLTLILMMLLEACQASPQHRQELSSQSSKFKLRPFSEITLSNGLPVLLIPDKKLPYLELALVIRSGASSDPHGKFGLSHLTAQLINKGTEKRSAIEITQSLEQLGSSLSIFSDQDTTTMSTSGLSFYKDQLLKDFSEVLLQPTFSKYELRNLKEKVLATLVKRVDKPEAFTEVVLQSYLYGNHPYSRYPTGNKKNIQSLRRKDILQFYKEHYTPKNSMLAVVGDFDDNIISQLETHLGLWQGNHVSSVHYPEVPKISGVQIRLVHRADVQQTQIRLTHKGIQRSHPDYLTLKLANIILGYDFGSRLVDEIRLKRGLTYHIGSFFDARKDFGPFVISTSTRHEKVGETIRETLYNLKNFVKDGVTKKELQRAKAVLKGNFPRALETADSLALNLLTLKFFGVPKTYLTQFYENVNRIRTSDVHKAIKRAIDPDNIKIVIYGPKDQTIEQIRSIGAVEIIDYQELL